MADKLEGQAKRIAETMKKLKALTIGTLSDKLGAWGDYFSDLAALTGTNSRKLLASAKSCGAAPALLDAGLCVQPSAPLDRAGRYRRGRPGCA